MIKGFFSVHSTWVKVLGVLLIMAAVFGFIFMRLHRETSTYESRCERIWYCFHSTLSAEGVSEPHRKMIETFYRDITEVLADRMEGIAFAFFAPLSLLLFPLLVSSSRSSDEVKKLQDRIEMLEASLKPFSEA